MTGQSEDNKPSLEVSPGEVRVTKLRNLWQRYKKTLSEGSKTSLGDFVEYIKSHDAALFDEITQTNHDDFLQGWEEKNKHFAHIVWGIIHPQEENGQSRRDFLTTLTGATSALATSFLSGWTGPSIFDREMAEFVVRQVMIFNNSLITGKETKFIDSPFDGPIRSWANSVNFLGTKKEGITRNLAMTPGIGAFRDIQKGLETTINGRDHAKTISILRELRLHLSLGKIGDAVVNIQAQKYQVVHAIVAVFEALPETIKKKIQRNYLFNVHGLKPSEIIRECLQMHGVDLAKKTKEGIRQVRQDIASYMTHYHGRAIVEDMLKREGVGTVEQYLKIKERELSRQHETAIEEITRACQSVINQVAIIEKRYSPLSTQ